MKREKIIGIASDWLWHHRTGSESPTADELNVDGVEEALLAFLSVETYTTQPHEEIMRAFRRARDGW